MKVLPLKWFGLGVVAAIAMGNTECMELDPTVPHGAVNPIYEAIQQTGYSTGAITAYDLTDRACDKLYLRLVHESERSNFNEERYDTLITIFEEHCND